MKINFQARKKTSILVLTFAFQITSDRITMDHEEPKAKRPRRNGSKNAAVVVAAPNIEQTADIFKLDIDCFEEAFDYLPIKDLISVGQICKRLHEVAEYCFRLNYANQRIWSKSNKLQMVQTGYYVTPFVQSIRKIEFHGSYALKDSLRLQPKLRRLKQISFGVQVNLRQTTIDQRREMLCNVTDLRLESCKINFREIIAHCPNLKRLAVNGCETDLNWLDRKCPTLECLEFLPSNRHDAEIFAKIMTFLKQNQNIRKFSTDVNRFLVNRNLKLNISGIKLDVLVIRIAETRTWIDTGIFCHQLKFLHRHGFFKQLHVYDFSFGRSQQMIDRLATVNGIVKLSIVKDFSFARFSAFTNLEELVVSTTDCIADTENMANNLINLRRILVLRFNFAHLMPFIRRTATLDKIRVAYSHVNDVYFNRGTDTIDLVKLNEERARLPGARKITIYVGEGVYLATKRALKKTDFELIRLKRRTSFDWDHDFEW